MAGASAGFADGTGSAAKFDSPNGIAVDRNGVIYVADAANHRVRRISPQGDVSTLAGSFKGYRDADGAGAQFNSPYGVAVDQELNVYVADTYNHRIRRISPGGEVSTVAGSGTAGFRDGTGFQAQFNLPFSLDVDDLGNVYVADAGNHRIRKISPLGAVTTVAGTGTAGRVDGEALQARFSIPNDVAIDANRNLFVADFGNHCIRKISFGGQVSTVAGNGLAGAVNGVGPAAQLNSPTGLFVDKRGVVYVADNANNKIRQITADGQVTSLAGTGTLGFFDGAANSVQFSGPTDIVLDSNGTLYISDTGNNRVRSLK